MICPKCGAELPDTAELCWSCRMKFISSDKAEKIAKKRLALKKISIIASALVIIGIIVFIVLQNIPPNLTLESFLDKNELFATLGEPTTTTEGYNYWDDKVSFCGVKVDRLFIKDSPSLGTYYTLLFSDKKIEKIYSIVKQDADDYIEAFNSYKHNYGNEELTVYCIDNPLSGTSEINKVPVGEAYAGYYGITIAAHYK